MFKFKNISNIEMKVLPVEENFSIRAPLRINQINVEGRSGSQFNELGYDNVVSTFSLQLLKNSNKDELLGWLQGVGTFEFDGKYTTMHIYDAVAITRDSAIERMEVNYIRDPFWYQVEEFEKVNTEIVNYGNTISQPQLLLKGSGTIDVTINTTRFIYHFDEDNEVIIDCLQKTESYQGISKSKNIEIGFEYPVLNKGSNMVKIHQGNVEIYAKRRSTWL